MNQPSSTMRHKPSETIGAGHPLAKACDQCHRCKVACDGEKPRCQRCSRSESACTYSLGKAMGKPRVRRNRNQTEELRIQSRLHTESLDRGTVAAGVERGGRKRKASEEDAEPHKRHRSGTDPSISSERNMLRIGEIDISDATALSSSSLPTTCDTEKTIHDFEDSTYTFPLHDVSAPALEQGLDFAEDLHFENLSAILGSPLCIPDVSFMHSSAARTEDIVKVSDDLKPVAAHDSVVYGKTSASSSCDCISTSIETLSMLQTCPISVEDSISILRQAQDNLAKDIDSRVASHKCTSWLLMSILILQQLGARYKDVLSSRKETEIWTSISVVVCGMEISIGGDDMRGKILDAVISTQIHQALVLSDKLVGAAEQSSEAEGAAFTILIASVRKELETLLPPDSNS